MSSLLTDGSTAWHHASQWLNPMLLNRGTASNTMLLDEIKQTNTSSSN